MTLFRIEKAAPEETQDSVVLLHGFGGCAAQWRGLQRDLSATVDSIAFDLPGHAGSRASGITMSPKNAANAILAEMSDCDKRLHIVGHSMGGAVASLMAILAPNRIASLTLLAPGGFGPQIAHETLTVWAQAKTREEIAAIMPSFFGPSYSIIPQIIDLNVKLRNEPDAVSSLVEIAKRLARDGRQGVLPLDDLWQTPIPISIIWGSDDAILPVEQARSLQPLADQGRIDLHIVDGMGHSPAEEAPKLVRDVIGNSITK